MVSDRKAYNKQYSIDNKEKIRKQRKQYRIDNSKKLIIKVWKQRGLKDDFDMVWERYVNSTHCENCNVVYGKIGDGTGTWKCMDHDHTKLENNFRNILCNRCNSNDHINNKSGYPNICKKKNGWEYSRMFRGKTHSKRFKYYYDAIVYKYLYEAFNLY